MKTQKEILSAIEHLNKEILNYQIQIMTILDAIIEAQEKAKAAGHIPKVRGDIGVNIFDLVEEHGFDDEMTNKFFK